jgi:hypothetical protein
LTTIYLGFGVFTLESSFQFKTGHYSSTGQQLLYERQTRGYLLPGQLAFLLAAQLSARSCGKAAVAKVLSALSANHAQAVRSAYEQFSQDSLPLREALRLPAREVWPAPADIAQSAVPLAPTEVQVHDAPNARKAQWQSERIAFRVAGNRSLVGLGLGLAGGFSAAIYLELVNGFWPLTLGAAVVAWDVGRRIPAPTCSACSRGVASAATQCACKARLVGDVKKPEERFSAEEAYLERERARRAEQVQCPECHWQPRPDSQWHCSCRHRWNRFETRGQCPHCGKQWQTTACLKCKKVSAHENWYTTSARQEPGIDETS